MDAAIRNYADFKFNWQQGLPRVKKRAYKIFLNGLNKILEDVKVHFGGEKNIRKFHSNDLHITNDIICNKNVKCDDNHKVKGIKLCPHIFVRFFGFINLIEYI